MTKSQIDGAEKKFLEWHLLVYEFFKHFFKIVELEDIEKYYFLWNYWVNVK